MKRIAIDIDGVLAFWSGAFARVLTTHGAHLRPFEDDYEPSCWDWPRAYGATEAQETAAWHWVTTHPGWWATLAAHKDFATAEAQRALDNLCRYHEVTFVSSRPNGRNDLIEWLKYYLAAWDAPQTLLTPGDKVLALVAMQPHVIIEDRLPTLRAYARIQDGASMPQAELILIKRPYNGGEHSGLTVVNSTLEALERAAEVVSRKEAA